MFKPKEIHDRPGFYEIPGIRNYAISKSGRILNLYTGNFLSPFKMSNGYFGVHTPHRTDGKKVSLYHRMIALAFIDPKGADTNTLQVNHIDGNKQNNSIDNLEWVTPQENCIHAGITGLSPKCLAIDVRDPLTGEEWHFPSFVECARHFGVSKDVIRARILLGRNGYRVYPEWKQYRLHSDDPWPDRDEPVPDKYGRKIPVEVKDLKSGEVTEYASISEAAADLGTTLGVLFSRMNMTHQPILPGLKQIRFASDKEWRVSQNPLAESFQTRRGKPVMITDTKTGKVTYHRTCSDAARYVGIMDTTMHERLRSNGNTVFSDGRTYQYLPISHQSAANESWQCNDS